MGAKKRINFPKRFLSFALVIMLIFTMIPIDKVYAADVGIGTDGNAVDLSLWNYSVSGNNYSLGKYKGSIVNGKIVGSVPANINGKPVTIMSYTFSGCTGLTEAPEIPSGVTSLNYTFLGCIGLTEAPEIPNGVTYMTSTFNGCKGLTEAPEIPSSVTSMSYTFSGCIGLTEAPEIPSNVTNMNGTLSDCRGLTEAPEIPSSVTDMSYTFSDCRGLIEAPRIPNGVTNMSYTFRNCEVLTKAPEIPNSVTDMSNAFFSCKALQEAPRIPSGVTNMSNTFSYCTVLTEAPKIPNNVTNMYRTFYYCTNLTGNVSIPQKITELSDVFLNTSKPITMIYSSNNIAAASYTAPSNVTKAVDTALPEISSVTQANGTITVNATDNYSVEKYAVTTLSTAPTTGWQASNVFSITSDGTYYAWAMDGVGNVSAGKAVMYPQALGTDGKAVDLSLWNYTENDDTYCLNDYKGSIVDGKIVGSVPAKINGKPVTALQNTFKDCTALTQAPVIPIGITNMEYTFSGCKGLEQAPKIPDGVTDMSYTFNNCIALTQPPVLPNSVTNMEYTFSGCKVLKQAPQIPDGVTNMRYTFNNCTSLAQPPVLPSSVTTINHAFYGCIALTQVPEIPNSVTDMNAAFWRCTKLTQTPQIPDSVIDMSYAFYMCTALTSVPVIPNSIKNMNYTFYGCKNLTGEIFIPNSVIKMSNIFTDTSMPITMIYSSNNTTAASYTAPSNITKAVDSASPEISSVTEVDGTITINATDNYSVEKYAITTSSVAPTTGWQTSNVFSNMSDGKYYAWAMDKVANVSIRKAFMFPQVVAVGTDGSAVDMLLWNFTDNGDTYSLDRYTGSIFNGKIVGSVPVAINGKPVTVMSDTFKDCTALTQAPVLPSTVTNMEFAFSGCKGLLLAPQIPDGVTNMNYTFNNCTALTQSPEIPSSVTDMRYTFNGCIALEQPPVLPSSVTTINHAFAGCTALTQAPEIPNIVTDMVAAFSKCTKLTQTPQIPDSVIDMSYAFYMCTALTSVPAIPNSIKIMNYTFLGCTNLTGNIFVPNSVIKMSNIFTDTSMPITMIYSSNNTAASSYTAPSNVTKAVDLALPEISSVTEMDKTITINATDNYSIEKYAVTTSSTAPTTGWQTSNVFSNMSDGKYYAWAMDKVGNLSIVKAFMYPQDVCVDVAVDTDGNAVDLLLWDFTDNGYTYSLDRYTGNIFDGEIIGSVPAVINGKPVTVMSNTFKDCTDLTKAPEIPSTVTNMEYVFSGCKGLKQAPQIPDGVDYMSYAFNGCTALVQVPILPSSLISLNHTFSGCSALTLLPEIPNSVTDMYAAFSKCTKLAQTPQIPDSVIDMSYAFYMCTALTSIPVIPNGIKDMNYTFFACTNLTGEIFIPNSVIRMSNILTGTTMPITMKYLADNTTASSYTAPSNVTKVIGTLELPEIDVLVGDTTVDEAAGTATFTVSLSRICSSDITVDYFTTNNTATAGDYKSTAGTVTIPAGSVTVDITVPITNDTDYEKSESFYLNLTNPSTGDIIDNQGECTITDNDSLPAVNLSLSDSSCPKSGGTSTITATLSNKSYQDVTVNLHYSGTAINGTDYITSGSAIVIPSGSLSNSITLTAIDNTINTGNRTVILSISGIENGVENGTQQQTLTIRENNVNLASLSISSGALTPAFAPDTLAYTAPKVPYGTSSVTVSAIAVDPTSIIKVNGVAMVAEQSTVYLAVGINTINVLVTALDGSTKTYNIAVERIASSYLSALSAQVGGTNMVWTELMPLPFVKTTTSYTYNVGFDAENIKITPTPEEADAVVEIRINDSPVGSGVVSTALKVGQNTVTVTVTAAGGTLVTTYNLSITRAGSTYLSAISCTRGSATPAISKNPPYNYTLKAGITAATTTITLTAEDAISTTITLQVDAKTYSSTNGMLVVPYVPTASSPGKSVTATVSSSTGVPSTVYTISVVKVNPAKVAITAFNLNGVTPNVIGTVNEASKAIALTVPYGTDVTALVPTITHSGASIFPNTGVEQDFTNPVKYTVTSVDSTTQEYTVTVTVAANSDLSNLTISNGVLTPTFAPSTLAYTAPKLPYNISSVTVSAIAVDPTSTIKVNGVAMVAEQSTVYLAVGINTINVLVTALDGSTKTYNIAVEREQGAILSNLSISSGTLNPAFYSGNLTYTTQNVGYDIASVTVTPTTNIAGCTITVNGSPATSGQPSPVNLAVGSNTINIVVTNGAASQTYTIAVVRESSPYLSSVTGIPGINFVKTTYTYTTSTTLAKLKNIVIIPMDTNAVITLTMNGMPIPDTLPITIPLISGANVLVITCTSASGGDSRTYTFNINKV